MYKKILLGLLLSFTIISAPIKVNADPVADNSLPLNTTFDLQALIDAHQAQLAAEAQAKAALEAQAKAIQEAQAAQIQAALDAQAKQAKAAQDALALAQQAQQTAALAASTPQQIVPISSINAATMAKSYPDFVYISISDQMAYFYRNGLLITQGPCVTGNASKHYDTTVGFHQIVFMDTNRTLHGSYGEAFVKYWMRFTKGGQGLHDAGWRKSFGGDIYKTNGSHGCVNLQRDVAKTIYSYAYVGLPVIVVP